MTDRVEVTAQATRFRERIKNAEGFLATCDGGDPGSPERPSIWLLGLEPGWSVRDDQAEEAGHGISNERHENYAVDLQMEWPFNRNAFKLLAALNGEAPEAYVDFAVRERPFERGSIGFLKANLFPAACNSLGAWKPEHTAETGFDSKQDYQRWMRETRFPILREWIARSRPKLIICTGLTHMDDFLAVTGTTTPPPAQRFEVNGHWKRVHVAADGLAPIAIIPHLSGGSHSLNSNAAIRMTARCINDTLGYSA